MKHLAVVFFFFYLSIVGAVSANASVLSPRDQQIYIQAFDNVLNGRYNEGLGIAISADEKLPVKILQWIAYKQPGNSSTFREISDFITHNPSWPHLRILQRRAETNITPSIPAQELLSWFATNPPLTFNGSMAYIQTLQSTNDTRAAQAEIQRTWGETDMDAAQESQFLGLYGDSLTTKDLAARLSRLLWSRQFAAAKRLYPHLDASYQALSEARIALGTRDKNATALLRKVPASLQNDPGLIYERVRWRRLNNLPGEAIDLMLANPKAVSVYPDKWWTERGLLTRTALQQGLISQAYRLAQTHEQKQGVGFADAEWLAGWIALRFQHEPKKAYPHFVTLYEGVQTPASRARGAYWAGRAADAFQDTGGARRWYEKAAEHSVTYHGQLAMDQLGGDGRWTPPADPLPSSDDIRTFENHELTRVVRLLNSLGLSEETRPFLLRLNDLATTPGQRSLAASLATTINRPDMAVFIARRAERDGIPLISTGFPIPDLSYDKDPEKALILGLIRQESAFHTAAVSSAGARGLMQLMPDTAKRVAKDLGVSYMGVGQLTADPSFNVSLGTSYLRTQLSDFSGSYIMALAAYNAGPNRVRRWVNDFGDPRNPTIDPIDWIEMIPFTETRTYVQKVLENVQIYRHRLGESVPDKNLARDLRR